MTKKFHIPSSSDTSFGGSPPRPGAKLVHFWAGGKVTTPVRSPGGKTSVAGPGFPPKGTSYVARAAGGKVTSAKGASVKSPGGKSSAGGPGYKATGTDFVSKARGGGIKAVTGKQRDPGLAGAIKSPASMPTAMPPMASSGMGAPPSPMQGMGIVAPRPRAAMPSVGGALSMGRRPGGI